MTREERCELLGEVTRAKREVLAAQVDLLDLMDDQADFAPDGHRSLRNLVVAQTNCDMTSAGLKVRAMIALRALPEMRSLLAAGEIGVAQIQTLAPAYGNPRVRGDLPKIEDQLLVWAGWDWAEFDRCVDDFVRLVDSDGAEQRARRAHEDRHFRHAHTGGNYHGTHSCGAAQGAAIDRVMDHFERAEFDADWTDAKTRVGDGNVTKADLTRTAQQRRADAFHAMCLAAAAATPGLRPPAPLVNIVMDPRPLAETIIWATTGVRPDPDLSDIASRRCHTTDGVPMPPGDALAAMLQGHVRRVVIDRGVTIDMGRRQRLFRGNNRDAAMLRNTHCVWAGCDIPTSHCETDHGTPWVNHGATNAADGAPLCGRHNKWKTRGYTVHQHPDGTWHTVRPDGTNINRPPRE
jgi:hypothetical protein